MTRPTPAAALAPEPSQAAPFDEGRLPATVLQQFRIILRAVKLHFQHVERATGLAGAQMWALSVIQANPGIGVSRLAERLSVRQPTASVLVRNLTQQGLVEALRDESDRRSVHLTVLPAGSALLLRSPRPLAGLLPDALGALGPDVLSRLSGDLGRLIDELGADGRLASLPLDGL